MDVVARLAQAEIVAEQVVAGPVFVLVRLAQRGVVAARVVVGQTVGMRPAQRILVAGGLAVVVQNLAAAEGALLLFPGSGSVRPVVRKHGTLHGDDIGQQLVLGRRHSTHVALDVARFELQKPAGSFDSFDLTSSALLRWRLHTWFRETKARSRQVLKPS